MELFEEKKVKSCSLELYVVIKALRHIIVVLHIIGWLWKVEFHFELVQIVLFVFVVKFHINSLVAQFFEAVILYRVSLFMSHCILLLIKNGGGRNEGSGWLVQTLVKFIAVLWLLLLLTPLIYVCSIIGSLNINKKEKMVEVIVARKQRRSS